jgi:hypothetical protein
MVAVHTINPNMFPHRPAAATAAAAASTLLA